MSRRVQNSGTSSFPLTSVAGVIIVRMASERVHFAFDGSYHHNLGKEGVSRGVFSWLHSATMPLDANTSHTLCLLSLFLLSQETLNSILSITLYSCWVIFQVFKVLKSLLVHP